MAGSFSYNAGSNTVTVTGGTSGSPADFASLVAADRAGTLNSQDARNITGVDGSPVAVTQAIRPVERLVLGGPAHTLYLVITNWNATSATIRIVGTDYDGNAQQEDIAISGNGTLYTVNRYKTITSTQVTALSGTGFTYTLTQTGWGVIWDKGGGQYQIDALLVIGDGTTSTYMADTLKQIYFNQSSNWPIDIKANATFRSGTWVSDTGKLSKDGCSLIFSGGSNYLIRCQYITGTLILYSSFIMALAGSGYIQDSGTGSRYWNCLLRCISSQQFKGDMYNITSHMGTYGIQYGTGTFDTINLSQKSYTIYSQTTIGFTVRNIIVRNSVNYAFWMGATTVDCYCINCDIDNWNIGWSGSWTSRLYRQYTLDLHLTDINGNPISGATVTLKDNGGNTVFSVTTGADGKIAQQTVNRGYYDQAHGDTLQDYGPHTLTIANSGYQNYQEVITIDRKMDLEVALLATVTGGRASPIQPSLLPLGIMEVVA
jgi:hypothetical protein